MMHGLKRLHKQKTEYPAGYYFSRADREHKERYAVRNSVSVGKYKRDNERVCEYGGDRREPFAHLSAEEVCTNGSDKCGEASEDDVPYRGAGDKI